MSSPENSRDDSPESASTAVPAGQNDASRELENPPSAGPGRMEEELGSAIDNVVPSRGYEMLPMVGLGGSAGSIKPLQEFFRAMPTDTGMVFVVILHLSPEFDSSLAELLSRVTAMPVHQAIDGVKVEANAVYVIPPGKHLASADGCLRLTDLQPERGKRIAVDLFFRTLADTHGAHSAAIVLSGADSDGAIGIKRIKERGGLTIAQDPSESEYPEMPRAAIGTGMVDWVLKVEEMPDRLIDYRRQEKRLKLPPEEGPQPAQLLSPPPSEAEAALRDILVYLRTRTHRDFSYYKRATILRRIGRRMRVNGIDDLPRYLAFLRIQPGEAGALLQDLLISVTNFFRDREAFDALELRIPELFHGKGPSDVVRVWVSACATGEEAYSIAMLLCEYARKLDAPPLIQVFATDLDEVVVQAAREGVYPLTITADVSEERLRYFFVKEHRGYRVRREVREVVLFALHDLLKDSPFSRLDLISCRNLLIYLNREAQQRAFEIFHFALRPEGRLFLGTSESVDEDSALFSILDKKHRIYGRRSGVRLGLPAPGVSGAAGAPLDLREHERPYPAHYGHGFQATVPTAPVLPRRQEPGEAASWSELHFRMLELLAPPSILVNHEHEIMHLSQSAGQFLQFPGGEPTKNLLRAVHPMLRIELRAALYRASQTGATTEVFQAPWESGEKARTVTIRVSPATQLAPDFFLVVFDEQPATNPPRETEATHATRDAIARQLERELDSMKSHLRDVVEQYEASTEELKASNEELQAMNEELRSATEELETSREELQSINEELTTVNVELKSKVDELAHANSDLQNLMGATSIATIFLDRELRITRFTPSAVDLFRLIPTDLGRPLTDLKHRLDYQELEADAARVLERLLPVEREVGKNGGSWFLARLLPYRTADDRIAGVVLSFVDITELHRAQLTVRARDARIRQLVTLMPAGVYTCDAGGCIDFYNRHAVELWGREPKLGEDRFSGSARVYALDGSPLSPEETPMAQALRDRAPARDTKVTLEKPSGQRCIVSVNIDALVDDEGHAAGAICVFLDVTERTRAEEALRASDERLRLMIESAREYAIFSTDLELRVTSWNSGAQRLLGFAEHEILGKKAEIIFTPEDRAGGKPREEAGLALKDSHATDERWHLRKDGSRFWASGFLMSMHNALREPVGFVKILRDQTQAREAQEALETSRQQLWEAARENERARAVAEEALRTKDHFLAVLSHELRTPLTPVLMAVHTLARRSDLPEPAVKAMEMIQRNIELEAHFIDELLDLTRISRGKIEIVREPMDLHEAAIRAVEISSPDIEAKRQRFSTALDAGKHRVLGDFTRLQQVFWNLLKNASKFTPDEGEISIGSHNEPGCVVVTIRDSGIGINAEAMAKIFAPFEQGSAEIAREFGGLGLGLAIAKATANAHGGQLVAASAGLGRGATFAVTLPLL